MFPQVSLVACPDLHRDAVQVRVGESAAGTPDDDASVQARTSALIIAALALGIAVPHLAR